MSKIASPVRAIAHRKPKGEPRRGDRRWAEFRLRRPAWNHALPSVYDRATIGLHWFTAVSVAILWIIGQTADWSPDGPVKTAYWSVHVALGFVLAGVLAWRVMWRASGGRRLPVADNGALQAFAKAIHYLRYVLLIVVVVLGIVNAFVRGYNLFDLVSLPQIGERSLRRPITHWHGLVANILLGLALFHAAAALVHHYLWRDDVLRRILPVGLRPH